MQEAEAQPRQQEAIPAPVVEEPVKVPTPRVEVPRVDAREFLSGAGLQMVETNPSKLSQPAPEPEPVTLGRPRRERPQQPAAAEEALVQVETRDK